MSDTQIRRHTIIAWLEDKPSVLNRVTGLFSRRNFNIESLNVGHSETPGISRMTFVTLGTGRDLQQVTTQLDKLINVVHICDVTSEPAVVREMALIKVTATSQTRGEIMQLVEIYRASVVDVDMTSLIIQIVAPEDRVNSLISLLGNFGIEEMVRTGRVAMVRGNSSHGHNHGAREWTEVAPVDASLPVEQNGYH
ncbi:MAG: acetolactate synthase small subunit [Anaerolineae bacterium]|nr:acetolactate synthase small subunit [Anaerolineae bacterium]RIK20461.1 MAG: acetolactate synthase small subunit [Anaerolineae bacterium]